ncbi:MAG: hypothetical protein VX035_05965 [Planctomycetota bacterium]|nr:hypothetical protein [Planctomycetota bacterium]MEE3074419.1 hypothetical protein [Planctomycetota bacterium]
MDTNQACEQVDPAKLKLEARIRRHYPLRWLSVDAAGKSFQVAKVADPDLVFDEAIDEEKKLGKTPLEWQP